MTLTNSSFTVTAVDFAGRGRSESETIDDMGPNMCNMCMPRQLKDYVDNVSVYSLLCW